MVRHFHVLHFQSTQLQYFGHVVRADNLCTHILHGITAGNRRRGRPRRRWTDDIKQWTGIPVADCVKRQETEARGDLGVRVGDLRSSDMRKDLGKARQGVLGVVLIRCSQY